MQKLHLVGFTTDQEGLILSARRGARSGGYVLTIDDALEEAVDELRARREQEAAEAGDAASTRVESALPVREIQARLRQGRSVDDVARAAGVEPSWVERFAPPVLAERARVIAKVRATPLERARLGPSALAIGDAVRRHLADRGVALTADEFDAAWSTRQLANGRWIVRFAFFHRAKNQTLQFDLDESTGSVAAADRLSAQLGYVAPKDAPKARVNPASSPAARSAKERQRAADAMRKAAAKRAAEAERNRARREREKAAEERRREKEAKAKEAAAARAQREKEAAKKKAAAAKKKAAAAKKQAAATKKAAAKKAAAKKTAKKPAAKKTAKKPAAKKTAKRSAATERPRKQPRRPTATAASEASAPRRTAGAAEPRGQVAPATGAPRPQTAPRQAAPAPITPPTAVPASSTVARPGPMSPEPAAAPAVPAPRPAAAPEPGTRPQFRAGAAEQASEEAAILRRLAERRALAEQGGSDNGSDEMPRRRPGGRPRRTRPLRAT